MNSFKKVAILLATYNGEAYLREQMESLFNQSFKDWVLYVHDDGSNDDTINIINEYKNKYDNIEILKFAGGCGAKESFLKMLFSVEADYFFFCDQDDVWEPYKVEKSLSEMEKIEMNNSVDAPVVIHSDLQVVDKDLNVISPSFWDMMLIRPEKLKTFNQLGTNCLVTGCTMLINRAAKECTIYPADNAVMHDVWVVLCVAKNKGIVYGINQTLIKYRQHGNNTLGARDMRRESRLYNKILNIKDVIQKNASTYRMLKDLNYGSVFKYLYYKILYKI